MLKLIHPQVRYKQNLTPSTNVQFHIAIITDHLLYFLGKPGPVVLIMSANRSKVTGLGYTTNPGSQPRMESYAIKAGDGQILSYVPKKQKAVCFLQSAATLQPQETLGEPLSYLVRVLSKGRTVLGDRHKFWTQTA